MRKYDKGLVALWRGFLLCISGVTRCVHVRLDGTFFFLNDAALGMTLAVI